MIRISSKSKRTSRMSKRVRFEDDVETIEDSKIAPKISPMLPFAALGLCGLVHTMNLTQAFPYIGFMVIKLGMETDRNKTGFYAGYIFSSYMVGRMASSYIWGVVADRKGRKPILIMSLIAISFLSLGFGVADSFAGAVVMRLLLGSLDCIIMLGKMMVSEIGEAQHQEAGMGLMTSMWMTGYVIGPAMGGLLYDPADLYPTTFPQDSFFGRRPFLLPNMVCAVCALFVLPSLIWLLPETHNPKQHQIASYSRVPLSESKPDPEFIPTSEASPTNLGQKTGAVFESTSDDSVDDFQQTMRGKLKKHLLQGERVGCFSLVYCCCSRMYSCLWSNNLKEIASTKVQIACLALFGFVNMLSQMVEVLIPLWTLSSKEKGGLSYQTSDIGNILSSSYILVVFVQLYAYPRLSKSFGVVPLFRWSALLMAPTYLALPLISLCFGHSSTGSDAVVEEHLVYFLVALVLLLLKIYEMMCYSSLSFMLNDCVPIHLRGRMSGFSMMIGDLSRVLGSVIASNLYAWSLHSSISFVNYASTFFLQTLIGIIMIFVSTMCVPMSIKPERKHGVI